MTHRILLFLAAVAAAAQVPGPRRNGRDYVHTGMAAEEHFALDGVVLEGEWPGPLDRWTDESNLGKYYFQVLDRATNRVIYSRGFASIYGEWETTGEAKQQRRAFSESVRFPAPALPVQVVIKKRGPRNEFREVWSIVVDPSDAGVERGAPPKLNVWAVMQNGAPRDKVDLLLMGDGYTATEMEKWHRDARRMVETLFAASPFKEHRQDFNVWAVDTPAEESGVARPSDGISAARPCAPRMTPLGRSVRPHLRQQATARGGVGRAVLVHRNRGQRPQVRGRRHLQSLRHRLRRQCVHALRFRARVRPPFRGAGRRILYVRCRLR